MELMGLISQKQKIRELIYRKNKDNDNLKKKIVKKEKFIRKQQRSLNNFSSEKNTNN